MIEANVIVVDGTATGTYVLTVCVHVRLGYPFPSITSLFS